MSSPLTVFIAGITGVFLGMAMLFLSIRLTGAAVAALEKNREDKTAPQKEAP